MMKTMKLKKLAICMCLASSCTSTQLFAADLQQAASGDAKNQYAGEAGKVSAGEASKSVTGAAKKEAEVEKIQIVGFRGALYEALDEKRNAVNSRESILAEDMGKFPDLNIAESIQRIPGVAISREGGEGRQITLRGLGPSFTRSTLNGMEVPASTDGLDSGGGINSGRSFDFNVFASELFNRVDIQKTSRASIEEGGMAGTVDLYSAKPFDYDGFKASASVQDGYNSLTSAHDPRMALMISNTFLDDKLGALFSIASSERTVRQEGFGTVRWTTPQLANQAYPANATPVIKGTPAAESCFMGKTSVAAINCLWIPRLPRADFFGNDQTRLGMTASVQFKPSDDALITFDALHSQLENQRINYNSMEWFLTPGTINPLALTIAPDGKQIIAGTFDKVQSWIESRQQDSDTDFDQYVLSGKFQLSDRMSLEAMAGSATSDAHREEYRMYSVSAPHIYSFDFTENADIPKVAFGQGYDYHKEANYEIRPAAITSHDVKRDNLTSRFDLSYEFDSFQLKSGFAYNDRSVEYRSGNGVYFKPVSAVGYFNDFPYADFGKGLAASLLPFPVVDFTAARRDLLSSQFTDNLGAAWIVAEKTSAIYTEANATFDVAQMVLRTNLGGRFVKTETTSTGYLSGKEVAVENDYNNFLPSANFALDVNEDVTLRLAAARTMTRASLNSLNIANPNFTYETRTVSMGNPDLAPYESNDLDLGVEWYFQEEALLSATMFNKKVVSSLTTDVVEKQVDPAYFQAIYADPRYSATYNSDPAKVPYTHYIPINTKDGFTIKGYELVYQQPFTFLPGWLSNFGFVTNYTRVSAEDMTGLSENSYNMTLYYEQDSYGFRVSANTRDDYILSTPGGNGHLAEMKYGPTHVDLSSFYNFNEQLTFTFEVINLTDEKERIYGNGDGSMNLTREYNHTGRNYFIGARYSL